MTKKSEKTLDEIEVSQAAMRESIEITKKLVDHTDQLIKRHRRELKDSR